MTYFTCKFCKAEFDTKDDRMQHEIDCYQLDKHYNDNHS